jgi:CRP/FNR family transcriptional regulator
MYEATIQRGPVIDELLRSGHPPRRIELAPGQVVHEPSDAAELFYVIESGEIRLYDAAADGGARLLDILGANEWFGSEALASLPTYLDRAVAVTPSVVWAVPAEDLRAAVAQCGELAWPLIETVARRLRQAWSDGSLLAFDDCRLRLIKTLLRFSKSPAAHRNGDGCIVLCMTHAQLAQAVGAARETISVCLTELRQQNVIRTGRNQLTFQPEALEEAMRKVGDEPVNGA